MTSRGSSLLGGILGNRGNSSSSVAGSSSNGVSSSPSLPSKAVIVGGGVVVGAGLLYLAYQSLVSNRNNKKKKVPVALPTDKNSTTTTTTGDPDEGGTVVLSAGGGGAAGWRLKGRRCLVAGAGDTLSIQVLLDVGADVTVIAPSSEVVQALREQIELGGVQHWDKPFMVEDVTNHDWDLVLYTYKDSNTIANYLVDACHKKKVPLHIQDKPDISNFSITMGSQSAGVSKKGTLPEIYENITKGRESNNVASITATFSDSIISEELGDEDFCLLPLLSTSWYVAVDGEPTGISEVPQVVVGIFDGYSVARYVGIGLSDVFYDFSFAEDSSLRSLEQQITIGGNLNFFGKNVRILNLDIRSGAGNALYGTLTSRDAKARVAAHVFTPSSGLVDMLPILHSLVHEAVPCVIHTEVARIGDDLSINPDLSDILTIQYAGVHVLHSTTPQEAHDMAIIAHICSRVLSTPFVHFFDTKTTSRWATTVTILSPIQIKQLWESAIVSKDIVTTVIHDNEGDSAGGKKKRIAPKQVADIVEKVIRHVEPVVGRKYELFSYVGYNQAEIVFVLLGQASDLVRDAVTALGSKFGAVVVRLLRPWDPERFVKAVPSTAQKVIVLGPVYVEVVAAFHHYQPSPQSCPVVFNVENASTYAITPPILRGIVEHVCTLTSSTTSITLPLPTEAVAAALDSNSLLELPPPSSVRGEVWEEEPGDGIASIISAVIAQTKKVHVATSITIGLVQQQQQPLQGLAGRVKSTFFQVSASGPLSSLDRAKPSDFLVVYDFSILSKVNVFANLKTGGTFILQIPFSSKDLDEKLPGATKREIAGKRLKFFVFEAPLAKEIQLKRLASFFAFSGVLQEVGGLQSITSVLKSIKHGRVTSLIGAIDMLSSSSPIPAPPAWLDAAENHDLLPAPQLKLIPKKDIAPSLKSSGSAQQVVKALLFPEAYHANTKLRPDIPGAHLVKVIVNKRLTPEDYERNVFHIEFDTTGTDLKYEIGEALGVHGHNDRADVKQFLQFYGLQPTGLVALPFKGSKPGQVHMRTVEQVFTQYLDIFGRPSKEFYVQLAEFATDAKEKDKLIFLTTPDGQAEYKSRVEETVTFADVLADFPSAHPPIEKLLELIPPIKPRHYSIASSMKMHPNSVHLLVVLVSWQSAKRQRFGQCTRYMAGLRPGDIVTVSVKPSVMTLPPLHSQPIIMAGLGTGMAPFRAFIQERAVLKSQGVDVGPIALYFGSRSRFAEYLYGEELEAYSKEGLLTYLRLAFSRDQQQKIYIQHKIEEDKSLLWQLIVQQKGHFYLCGPTWPEADVREALLSSFCEEGNMAIKDAEGLLEKIRADERYILELY